MVNIHQVTALLWAPTGSGRRRRIETGLTKGNSVDYWEKLGVNRDGSLMRSAWQRRAGLTKRKGGSMKTPGWLLRGGDIQLGFWRDGAKVIPDSMCQSEVRRPMCVGMAGVLVTACIISRRNCC